MKHTNLGEMTMDWSDIIEVHQTDIPEGFKSVKEIAKELGLELSHTRYRLRKLLDKGTIERLEIKESNALKHYYRIKE